MLALAVFASTGSGAGGSSFWGVRLARAAACALLLPLAAGCGARTPGIAFAPPGAAEQEPLPRVLWVERVSIEEPSLRERELTEVAYTYNLVRYLSARKLFTRVRVPPGEIGPDDWVASLRITRSFERVNRYPPGLLLSLLTLGVYAAVGPSLSLQIELDAVLDVRDGRGQPVGSSTSQHRANVRARPTDNGGQFNFWLDERSRVIDQLFDEILEARAEAKP
jgi:hypothetical protein